MTRRSLGPAATGPFLIYRGPLRPGVTPRGTGLRITLFPALRRLWMVPLLGAAPVVIGALLFGNTWVRLLGVSVQALAVAGAYGFFVVGATAGHRLEVREGLLRIICPGAPRPRRGLARFAFIGALRTIRDETVIHDVPIAEIRGLRLEIGPFHEGRDGRPSWQGFVLRLARTLPGQPEHAVTLVDGTDHGGLTSIGRALAERLGVPFVVQAEPPPFAV